MSTEAIFEIRDEHAMEALGALLAALLPERAVVGLAGPLGAGKTRLIQSVAEAAGVAQGVVASPTFVLIHEYSGRVPIYHFDAYRLRGDAEFWALGPEEYFTRSGWCLIEWADRVIGCLPLDRLEIVIEPTGSTSRRVMFRALSAQYAAMVHILPGQFTE